MHDLPTGIFHRLYQLIDTSRIFGFGELTCGTQSEQKFPRRSDAPELLGHSLAMLNLWPGFLSHLVPEISALVLSAGGAVLGPNLTTQGVDFSMC